MKIDIIYKWGDPCCKRFGESLKARRFSIGGLGSIYLCGKAGEYIYSISYCPFCGEKIEYEPS